MIDIKTAEKEFKNHIKDLEKEDDNTNRKINHMYRVAKLSRQIATELELTEEEINLAELIGLLHDLGRFEQYKVFPKNTELRIFDNTKKFDHGEAGVEVLKKNNYIRKYIKEEKYDNIIYKAIYEHNKYELSKNLTEKEELFCKIIKDADKIDILFQTLTIYWNTKEMSDLVENGILTEKAKEDFYNKKLVNTENRKVEIDQLIRFASFIYDINFKCSFEILNNKKYITRMIDRFDFKVPKTKEEFKKIKRITNEYIEDKIKG